MDVLSRHPMRVHRRVARGISLRVSGSVGCSPERLKAAGSTPGLQTRSPPSPRPLCRLRRQAASWYPLARPAGVIPERFGGSRSSWYAHWPGPPELQHTARFWALVEPAGFRPSALSPRSFGAPAATAWRSRQAPPRLAAPPWLPRCLCCFCRCAGLLLPLLGLVTHCYRH